MYDMNAAVVRKPADASEALRMLCLRDSGLWLNRSRCAAGSQGYILQVIRSDWT